MDQVDSGPTTSEAPRAPVAAVKAEQDEVDELAGETDAIAALPAPASHQHLQAVLLQQQQLQRSRPTHPPAGQREAHQRPSAAAGTQQQQSQNQNTAHGSGQSQNRCAMCGSVSASLWRREPHGQAICNACGLASIKRNGQLQQNALKMGSPRQTNGNHSPYAQKEDLSHTSNLSNTSEASTPQTLTSALPAQVAFSTGRQGSTALHLDPPGQTQAVTTPRQQLSQDQPSVPRDTLSPPFSRSSDERRRPGANASNGALNGSLRYAVSSGDAVKVVPNQRTDAPVGSCPGDGRCNGQGGKAACTGCPAFNNRHRIVTNTFNGRKQPEYGPRAVPQSTSLPLANREDFARSSSDDPMSVRQNHPSDPSASATAARTAVDAAMQASQGSEISAMACENCGTRTTPLWRRDGEGRVACNACGLYYKLHGSHRPVNMNKTTIKRRKRVPAVAGSQEGSIAGSAGPSGDQNDTGGPAKKKARKSQQNSDSRHQYNGAMSNGGAHDTHHDTSHSQRELTRTELEVIAALAMNANHERSLQHSASLDSDLLDHHSHPLHSVPASVPNDRFGSLVPPLAQPASELSFGSPQDRASLQSLTSEEDQIALYKQELAQECDRAKATMLRLQDFLARSESVLASLDERSRQAKGASSRSGESKEAGPSPLKHEVHAASPATNGNPEQPVKTLEHILANFNACQARPSQLLRKRKIDAVHDSKELHRANNGAVETGSAGRKRLLWEICPSGTTKIEVVASKPASEGSLVLPTGIVAI